MLLCTGGYGTAYYLSTNAVNSNVTAAWRAHKRGAFFANPCYTQIHPTCIPVSGTHQSKLTLMSESLRNDGRVWVPKNAGDTRPPQQIPEEERDYYLERKYPSFGNLVPRDVASRNAKGVCDEGRGVGDSGLAVYLDFADAIKRLGATVIKGRYGNLFDMYSKITDEDPYARADADLPRHPLHDGRPVGGLQPDEQRAGPARARRGELLGSRRQPARRQRADAGARRRLLRHPLHAGELPRRHARSRPSRPITTRSRKRRTPSSRASTRCCASRAPKRRAQLHRRLGQLLWDHVGMARNDAGAEARARGDSRSCATQFWQNLSVPGDANNLNKNLEYAGRVADYLEFAEVLALDALHRTESCGGHFREESQTPDGEALRDDANFSYAAAWEFKGVGVQPELHKEPLNFEYVKPSQRSYK